MTILRFLFKNKLWTRLMNPSTFQCFDFSSSTEMLIIPSSLVVRPYTFGSKTWKNIFKGSYIFACQYLLTAVGHKTYILFLNLGCIIFELCPFKLMFNCKIYKNLRSQLWYKEFLCGIWYLWRGLNYVFRNMF